MDIKSVGSSNNDIKNRIIKIEDNMEVERSESKIRLYVVVEILDSIFFDKKNDFIKYVISKKKDVSQLAIIDYLGNKNNRLDVIKIAYMNGDVRLCSIEDTLGYVVYNEEKSNSLGSDIWDYEYGDFRDLVDELKKRGIVFENDVYGKEDELYSFVSPDFIQLLKKR